MLNVKQVVNENLIGYLDFRRKLKKWFTPISVHDKQKQADSKEVKSNGAPKSSNGSINRKKKVL